jgi:hypothetical protein
MNFNFIQVREQMFLMCTNVAFGWFFFGTLGALDGTHVNIKVSKELHDSYVDRYLSHSINIMTICTAKNVLTYLYICWISWICT